MGVSAKSTDMESNGADDHLGVGTRSDCTRLCSVFGASPLRHLYAAYTRRTRRESPAIFLAISLLTSLSAVITSSSVFSGRFLPHFVISGLLLATDVIFYVVFALYKSKDGVIQFVMYSGCVTLASQIILNWLLGEQTTPVTDSLDWLLVAIYATLVLIPLFLYQCLIMAALYMVVHLMTSSIMATKDGYNDVQFSVTLVISQILLYTCAFILGLVTQYLINGAVKESFIQSKESLLVSIQIEESNKEQERLLLSVLPKHVADQMLQDMDHTAEGQFRRIYMNKHDNVSIMFADIVGFTALSSFVTPTELVKILNDLFATFDKLANKYNQLRIKILGDCYYCICGCPTPRTDHAVLCIHMGLAVVEAIKEVQQKTKSGVNMRVGIHTGSVLGGVLGQIRWQYDVFGRQVTMANKMESGGLPGKVHISEVTAKYLNNEFELEPGEGETREDDIKAAGLKTYLVKGVLKPYPEGTLNTDQKYDVNKEETQEGKTTTDDTNSTEKLEKSLMDREANTHISTQLSPVTLHFKEPKMEASFYSATRRTNSWLNIAAMATVTWVHLIAIMTANGLNVFVLGSLLLGAATLSILSLLAYLGSKNKRGCLAAFSIHIKQSQLGQIMWAALCSGVLLLSHFLSALGCSTVTGGRYLALPVNNETIISNHVTMSSTGCLHPQLFAYVGVIIMLAVTSLHDVEYLAKCVICVVIATCYCLLQWMLMTSYYDSHDFALTRGEPLLELAYKHRSGVSTILVALGCILINRHLERLSRKLHFYKTEIAELKHHAEALRYKNEALVYNILPAHVAKDFIGVRRDDEELYSHAYDEVGVMFASCPNFNDFYTEDSVNNDGLECIRLLNEILSDYDDLLNQDRFKTITKIKTIGSTFMAASGISFVDDNDDEKTDDITRWQHLADLVEFVLAMKDCLNRINDQSFNNFMLRVGLNHGPILAGVIGAKKPHYDIWGNTVNVASRMDSTGQLGKIQVIQSTMELLSTFGYKFEKRGKIKVKGKGELVTFFLTGKQPTLPSGEYDIKLPHQVA